MNTRSWTLAGYVTGSLAVALLITLAAIAFSSHRPMTPEFTVFAVADILLGVTAIKLLGDARTVDAIEERTSSYAEGVSDTVDRLAAALPQKDNVRRIG